MNFNVFEKGPLLNKAGDGGANIGSGDAVAGKVVGGGIETKDTEPMSYLALMKEVSGISSDTPITERLRIGGVINQHMNGFLDGRDEKAMDLGELSDAVFVLNAGHKLNIINDRIATGYWNALSRKLDDAVSAGRARVETKDEVLDEAKVKELEKEGYGFILRPYTGELIIINSGTPEAEEFKRRTIE